MNTTPNAPLPDAPQGIGGKGFFVTSLIFLVLACAMLAGRPDFLLTPTLTKHGVAWFMLAFFGCGLCGVFGVVYWAVPKVFGAPLYSEKIVFLHYGFHLAGTLMALLALVWPSGARSDMAMTFIACGAIAMGINILGTFMRPAKPDVASAFLATSVLWLLIVALGGLPFLGEPPVKGMPAPQWISAWMLLAITGVALNLPMGLALRLTPAVLGVKGDRPGSAWYALVFSNAGLAWMFAAAAYGTHGFLVVCAVVYAVGVLLYFARYFAMLQKRSMRVLPWDTKIVLTSVSLVPVAAGLLVWAAWLRIPAPVVEAPAGAVVPPLPPPAEPATGALPLEFLPVDAAMVLICLLCVAVPMIVALAFSLQRLSWSEAGGGFRGKLAEQILLAAYFNFMAGALLVVPGAWFGIGQMLGLGTLFLLVGSLGFLGNYFFAEGKLPAPALPSGAPAAG